MEDSTPLPANPAEDPPTAGRIEELQDKIRSMKARQASGTEPPPDSIGPYKILSVLGEGGMGTVYLAEQKTPVRRRVALKVIKLGMDSKQILARFEAERQALAMMEHSNIARVYEAGMTETGQPFFAMEHVKGTSINHFCDQHKLSLEERLTLFKQLCSGVQHAHQKGVIHRDLKPSNVLITDQDGKPTVKIIDFGVARATDHRLVEATIFTEQGQVIGTPEYMSPEQAGLDALDIDTRSDVYSLGVLLYELLVGELPFSSHELRRAGLREMERMIREEEPPKPSTRLTASRGESVQVAKQRHTDLRNLTRRLKGDLDWIVMKALEKNRAHRYGTAEALADDIHRHLSHEPILAGKPSAGYRFKKIVRRYRGQFAAAALVFLVLIGGIIGTSVGFKKARDNEELAIQRAESLSQALMETQAARSAEREQRERAENEANRAKEAEEESHRRASELERVVAFQETQIGDLDPMMMGLGMRNSLIAEQRAVMERMGVAKKVLDDRQAALQELLAGVNFTNIGIDMIETNVLAQDLAELEEEFAGQPLVLARLLQAHSLTLRRLGAWQDARSAQESALRIRRRELGDDHPDTLASIHWMGHLLMSQGAHAEGEIFYREALQGRRALLGNDHRQTLQSMSDLGNVLILQRKDALAEKLYVEALASRRRKLGDDDPDTLISLDTLGFLYRSQGKYEEAEPYYAEALKRSRRVLGPDDPTTLELLENMGDLFRVQEKFDEAEPYLIESLAGRRRKYGDRMSVTLTAVWFLARLRQEQGRLVEAEALHREAFEGRRQISDERSFVETSRRDLRYVLEQRGDYLALDAMTYQGDSSEAKLHQERMAAIADGELTARNSDEWVHAAYHLYANGRFIDADLTFYEAFDAAGAGLREKHRYNAARAAIRSGCGEDDYAGDLSLAVSLEFSRKGREMLREELDSLRKLLARGEVARALQKATWATRDPDLACVRDEEALRKLDPEEAKAWREFWTELRAVLETGR